MNIGKPILILTLITIFLFLCQLCKCHSGTPAATEIKIDWK